MSLGDNIKNDEFYLKTPKSLHSDLSERRREKQQQSEATMPAHQYVCILCNTAIHCEFDDCDLANHPERVCESCQKEDFGKSVAGFLRQLSRLDRPH